MQRDPSQLGFKTLAYDLVHPTNSVVNRTEDEPTSSKLYVCSTLQFMKASHVFWMNRPHTPFLMIPFGGPHKIFSCYLVEVITFLAKNLSKRLSKNLSKIFVKKCVKNTFKIISPKICQKMCENVCQKSFSWNGWRGDGQIPK